MVDFISGVKDKVVPQIALLHAYFDESGKWHDKDVISFCGLLSYADNWEAFAGEWHGLLDELDMSCLHTAEFIAQKGRYADGPQKADDEIEQILLRFIGIIRKYAAFGYGVSVDAKHFRSMPQWFREKAKNPHYAAFKIAMNMLVSDLMDTQRLQPQITWKAGVICDQDPGTADHCLKWFIKRRQEHGASRKLLSSICFADATGAVPLQAADLLAHTVRMEVEHRRKDTFLSPTPLYQALSTKPDTDGNLVRFFRGLMMDVRFINEAAEGKHNDMLRGLGIDL